MEIEGVEFDGMLICLSEGRGSDWLLIPNYKDFLFLVIYEDYLIVLENNGWTFCQTLAIYKNNLSRVPKSYTSQQCT